jgi:methionyl-tRNA formyltransferase
MSMSGARLRVVFMGSPDFAVPSLDALVASQRYRPTLVVSQPDRPRGRGQEVSPTPVRARALELGIPTFQMGKENYAEGVQAIGAEKPDAISVVAFGLILRQDLLRMPPRGCINVHASLLPRHRGVSPIQAAILEGDAVTGCTTMLIDEGVDTGDMLLQEETPINPDDTAGTLFDRLAQMGADLLVKTLDGLVDGTVQRVKQVHLNATITRKIRKAHGEIDWSKDADTIARQVRAMSPWPSAYTEHAGKRLIVEEVAAHPGGRVAEPGVIVSLDPLVVACGEGTLEISRLRPEGRRAMTAREYVSGSKLAAGDRMGSGD